MSFENPGAIWKLHSHPGQDSSHPDILLRKQSNKSVTQSRLMGICASQNGKWICALAWLILQKNAKNAVLQSVSKTEYLNLAFYHPHIFPVFTMLPHNRTLSIFLGNIQSCYFYSEGWVSRTLKEKREQSLSVQREEKTRSWTSEKIN